MLGQRCPNIGTSGSLTLAANIGPMAFWPAEATLAQHWQATDKNSTQCIALANQIAASFLTEGK